MYPSSDDEQSDDIGRDGETAPEPTADEIGEQIVGNYFIKTWGERPKAETQVVEQSEYARLHESPGTSYVSGLISLGDITSSLFEPVKPEVLPPPKISPELLARRDEIRALAAEVYGSVAEANRFFERKMTAALDRKRVAEHLNSLEGCDRIEEFLRTIND